MTGAPVPPERRKRAEDDDLLLVPRLVARIADLERQLFARQQHDEVAQAGTVSGRALALFKSAQRRIDAGVAYIIGDSPPEASPPRPRPASASPLSHATVSAALQRIESFESAPALLRGLGPELGELREALGEAADGSSESAPSARLLLQTGAAALRAAREAVRGAQAEAARARAVAEEEHGAAEEAGRRAASDGEARVAEVEARVAEAEARVAEADSRAIQAEALAIQAEARAAEAEALAIQAEARVADAETQTAKAETGRQTAETRADEALTAGRAAEERATRSQRELAERGNELVEARAASIAAQEHLSSCQEAWASDRARLEQERARLSAECETHRAARAALAQESNELRARLERAQGLAEEFQQRYLSERTERRRVHEELQALRGNIRVVCRLRPSTAAEERPGAWIPQPGCVAVQLADRRCQEFEFPAALGGGATQAELFDEVLPLVQSCVDGYNACILAYGQTGSGKTHSVLGSPTEPGIASRALQFLFAASQADALGEGPGAEPCVLEVSMLEIYNERVRDLLAAEPGSNSSPASLEVSALGAGAMPPGQERVPGLLWRRVRRADEALETLAAGLASRATSGTAMNAASSRSHALLTVRRRACSGGAPTLLALADLAGSERADRSGVAGERLRETAAINRSLSALGDVMAALQAGASHVPFRNSKLTAVLQDALCGRSKVLLLACLAPEALSGGESLSSLQFAQRAAAVALGPVPRAVGGRRSDEAPRRHSSSDEVAAGPPRRISGEREERRGGGELARMVGAAEAGRPARAVEGNRRASGGGASPGKVKAVRRLSKENAQP